MSYGFDMGFAQANSLQEAMAIALEYTQFQMTEKNIRKTIRDNRYYIPSVRTGYIADEESKNRRTDVLADTADRYWLEALFTFRFLYWEEHKLLGIVMMPPENASEKWPLSVYFQNSCDQDYPLSDWKEGNIPFFANAAAKAENYTAEEIRAKFDYEIEDENLEYYRRNTCYNDIFEALALEPWLYNHCTDVPFVTFAFQGIQSEAERYKAIVQKYDEKTVQQFAVLTAITMTALLENPEQDFLGTVYHNLGLSKSQAGQFFTPYNVGQMMARINMPDSLVLDKSRILRVNDPCCGAGCLLLAGYNVMREQLESTDPDWDKYVLFVAQDIDPLVCKMCYIQMCCIGVPGVVVVGNSLFPDAERAPTDFWFTHKYFALDEKALENTYQKTKE